MDRQVKIRGVRIDSTYQINTGGNTDFLDTGATNGNGYGPR